MSDMRRLRDETRSPFARALLESVEDDRSESGACDRALGALGLGTAGVVAAGTVAKAATVVAGSAATVSSMSSASSLAPAASKGGLLVLVKWIGIGILGSAVTIGSIAYVERETNSTSPREVESTRTALKPTTSIATAPAQPKAHAPIGQSAVGNPSPVVSDNDPHAAGATREPNVLSTSNGASVARDSRGAMTRDALGSESNPVVQKENEISPSDPATTQLAALSTIRAALVSGDPQRALTLLNALEARNPASPFAEEMAVLRIDALVDAGQMDEAAIHATAFANAYPQSAYGQHVRSKTKTR